MPNYILRCAALALLPVLVGCNGGPVADEEARSEVQLLRSRMTRLEDDIRVQAKKLAAIGRQLEKSAAEVSSLKKERAEAEKKMAETVAAPKEPAAVETPRGTTTTVAIAFDEFTLKVQKALKRAGYDPGPEDGKKGPNTTRALQAFQKENNIPTSGMADEATWALLKRYLE